MGTTRTTRTNRLLATPQVRATQRRAKGWRSDQAVAALTPLEAPPLECAEGFFLAKIEALCVHAQVTWYHPNQSLRDEPGFPDLVLLAPTRVLWRELKTMRGRVRPEQKVWLAELQARGEDARIWRPSDWPSILAELGLDTPVIAGGLSSAPVIGDNGPTLVTQATQPPPGEGADHVTPTRRQGPPAAQTRKDSRKTRNPPPLAAVRVVYET